VARERVQTVPTALLSTVFTVSKTLQNSLETLNLNQILPTACNTPHGPQMYSTKRGNGFKIKQTVFGNVTSSSLSQINQLIRGTYRHHLEEEDKSTNGIYSSSRVLVSKNCAACTRMVSLMVVNRAHGGAEIKNALK
jgi:hypothetical protein